MSRFILVSLVMSMGLKPVSPDFTILKGYGIDPAFGKAVAVVESGWGHNSRMALRDKNIFGMIGKRFDDVNEGIHYFARLIKRQYRTSNVDVIARRYCPPSWQEWSRKVKNLMFYLR